MSTALLNEAALGEAAMSRGSAILDALPLAVLLIAGDGAIRHANPAAEELFGTSAQMLAKLGLARIVAPSGGVVTIVEQVRQNGQTMFEYGVQLDLPRAGAACVVDVGAAPLEHEPNLVVLTLAVRTVAEQLGRHFQQRDSGRSNAAMAAKLAHEVRNPLSGIRGAAQLLESGAGEADKVLARMIRDESDRIAALIDRMEFFGDESMAEASAPLNVHELLDHVQLVAKSGFAGHGEIRTEYDPSLPLVNGNRDELIQAFLNLFKNAAEALPVNGGIIAVSTRYEHGLRVEHKLRAAGGGRRRVRLPIAIRVEDNGAGISGELRERMFEPFVTGKSGGTGLGLALVAKIVADHGGVVDVESERANTVFRILLPAAEDGSAAP